ncbi:ATP-binding cassette domain-containing protein [Streptomyces pseudovenezuelae]|uniref:ATP-binding cassette domain-containing protein n=1 Tax=Streptomyces pseudovenezuelae TaxID=67350 RepID=UPI00371DA8D5
MTRTLADDTLAAHRPLRKDLQRWLTKARPAGRDDESIEALFMNAGRMVGPNSAGKSTLLNLVLGMPTPTDGTIEVCGDRPASGVEQLTKIGFVAQDTPTYAALRVADQLDLALVVAQAQE